MATTDKNVKNPIINVLTKSQFDGIASPSADEFYLITDDSPIIAGTGLTASVSNGLTLLDHSNSITPVTTQAIYPIAIDAQGHITSVGTALDTSSLGKTYTVTTSGSGGVLTGLSLSGTTITASKGNLATVSNEVLTIG
jgi:hypothetical protein